MYRNVIFIEITFTFKLVNNSELFCWTTLEKLIPSRGFEKKLIIVVSVIYYSSATSETVTSRDSSSRTGARHWDIYTTMAVPGLLTWKGLLYLLEIVCVYGFNVDVQMPFIKQGPQNSYFGFSIAQHKINTSGQHL